MKIIIIILGMLLSHIAVADHSGEKHDAHHNKMAAKAIKVEIGTKGFVPSAPLNFKPNEKIVLNITRTTKKTCMTALKHPKTKKSVELPLNKEVRFEVGSYDKPKEITLLCGMGMKAGVVQIK